MNFLSYKALYREWRPKNFEDIIGQEHITITLKNEIINKRTSHVELEVQEKHLQQRYLQRH